jgi:ABC-type phosphate transport system substrate-binding protein
LTLVLDFETIAGIYLNNITTWSDTRIRDINSPAVASALPNETITVVIHEVQSAYTQLFTSMLSTMVPEFNETVRYPHPAFPRFVSIICSLVPLHVSSSLF